MNEVEYVAKLPFYRAMYDGKHAEVRKDSCSCRDVNSLKKVWENSIYEVCVFPECESNNAYYKYSKMLSVLLGKKHNVASCHICGRKDYCPRFGGEVVAPVPDIFIQCYKFILYEIDVKYELELFEMLRDKGYIKEL